MHRTIVNYNSNDHNVRDYKIWVTRMGCVFMRTKMHVKPMPTQAEEYYLWKVLVKTSASQVADKSDELLSTWMAIYKS